MVKFKEVKPENINNIRSEHRGRVSYPILRGFLETNIFLAELDPTGIQGNISALASSLNAYIRTHDLPIKLFRRKGIVYLMRLDIDETGEKIPNWKKNKDVDIESDAIEVTPETINDHV